MSLLYTINKLLKKVFPEKMYNNIRIRLLKINQVRLHVFTEAEIRDILRKEMGVREGSTVFVHSSMNQLRLAFPFFNLLGILKDLVGAQGTLLFPCWQNIDDPETVAKNQVFDVKKTPTDLGLLPEFARRQKGACRSLSPWNSVVALGKDAEAIVTNHHLDPLPCGFKSPFYQLKERQGIIIGLGVMARYLSFVHCPEDTYPGVFPLQTREDKNTVFKVKNHSGDLMNVPVRLPHSNIKHRNISIYLKKYISSSAAREFTIKGTHFFYADAKALYDEMQTLASKGITIYSV